MSIIAKIKAFFSPIALWYERIKARFTSRP